MATLHSQESNSNNETVPGTFLTTITDATTGAFSSRSLITLHTDRSMEVIDSGQGGPALFFSNQLGEWQRKPGGGLKARVLNFRFPSLGLARADYEFNANTSSDQLRGTITLTIFPLDADPSGGGGIVVGTFNFTGQRVTVP